jgi:hypothetical protein
MPAYYNVANAKAEYPWIDENFVPISQSNDESEDEVSLCNYPASIFGLTCDSSDPQTIPPTANTTIPMLTLHVNGQITSFPVSTPHKMSETQSTSGSESESSDTDEPSVSDDVEFMDGLEEELQRHMEGAEDEIDEEDAPDWVFEEGETRSKDPVYTFCLAPHRRQLLKLITKHFCRHPLLPESADFFSSKQIRDQSVGEMYYFCQTRGLREVWGYIWTSWYSPKMWRLWALSTSKLISRIRTTMAVENFWKLLKHDELHNLLRPRVDRLVWIIITKVYPKYMQRADALDDNYRIGRSKALTTYQKYIKREWLKLRTREISGRSHVTNVSLWLCSCGQQKYHQHLLCKHLVQAIPEPPSKFWGEIYRRRTVPFYRHPEICPEGTVKRPRYIDPDDGSITEGDDHLVSGNPKLLRSGGGWRDIEEGKKAYIESLKRRRSDGDSDDEGYDVIHSGSAIDMDTGALEDGNDAVTEQECQIHAYGHRANNRTCGSRTSTPVSN